MLKHFVWLVLLALLLVVVSGLTAAVGLSATKAALVVVASGAVLLLVMVTIDRVVGTYRARSVSGSSSDDADRVML